MVDLELTWQYLLSEFRPKQTKAVCVNQVDLSLWASMAVSMIYRALNVTLCVSLLNYKLPTSSGNDPPSASLVPRPFVKKI